MKVAIGPVFDEFGGVSQHIFGIKKYSSNNIEEIPSRFSKTIFRNGKLQRWLYKPFMNKVRLNNYDVVHSHVDPWFTNLCLSSRTDACKWVHTYHTLFFEEDYPNGLNKWQEAINTALIEVASKADVKISISKWLHDYLQEKYSIQTEIIPNGFNLDACDKANPDKFKEKYGLNDFVLFTGGIQSIKNPKLFIDMAIRMPEVRFVMIGWNLNAINLINEYNISIPKNLIIMNEMTHEDALDAISACKVFVMTSKREGFPTGLLEAMAMRKTVVAPAHSGCKDVVHSKDYGLLYEPGSLDDLIEQTNLALLSKNIGENARKRVAKYYDWKVLAKKIDLIYDD